MRHAQSAGSFFMAVLVCLGGCTSSLPSPADPPGSSGASATPAQPIAHFTVRPEGTLLVLGPQNTSDSRFYNTTIELPPGSVTQAVEVTASLIDSLAGPTERAVGPALRLTPADAQLLKPAQISLPYDVTEVSYLDDLRVVVSGEHQAADNALRRGVVGAPVPRLFKVTTQKFGDFQSLIYKPNGFPDMGIFDPNKIEKIDILFVVDNSSSMADKQSAVIGKFRAFVDKILKCTARIHIGVVTTDVGIVPAKMGKWPKSNDLACNTEAGDDGELQFETCKDSSISHPNRDDKKNRNDAKCALACKNNTKLTAGANFIDLDLKNAKPSSNIDVTGSVAPQDITDAFGCMAYQGDKGCGIEMPLESVRRALANPKNKNFWQFDPNPVTPRSAQNSLQLLVFITDEDDCSVPEMNRMDTDPANTVPYVAGTPIAKNFGHNFRCFAMSTDCTETLTTDGVKTNCKPKSGSPYLEDTNTLATSIIKNRKMLVGGIWALNPVSGDAMEYGTVANATLQYMTPVKQSQTLDFKLHECLAPELDPGAGAAEQHRLSAFADNGMLLAGYQTDICKPSAYADVFTILYDALHKAMPEVCKL